MGQVCPATSRESWRRCAARGHRWPKAGNAAAHGGLTMLPPVRCDGKCDQSAAVAAPGRHWSRKSLLQATKGSLSGTKPDIVQRQSTRLSLATSTAPQHSVAEHRAVADGMRFCTARRHRWWNVAVSSRSFAPHGIPCKAAIVPGGNLGVSFARLRQRCSRVSVMTQCSFGSNCSRRCR